jgi:hypothetical protein
MATIEFQKEVSFGFFKKSISDVLKDVLKGVLKKLNGLTPKQNTVLLVVLFDILGHNEEKDYVQHLLMPHLQAQITCINLGEFRVICEKLCYLIVQSANWSDNDRIHLESKINQFISVF